MSEAELQSAVIDLARWHGYRHYHTVDSRKSRPGFPDLVLVHERTGRLIFAELKAEKGRVRPDQAKWLALLGKQNEAHLWRPSDLASGGIERVLQTRVEAAA